MNGTKTFTVSTKPNEDGTAVQTALTLDLEGCSDETVLALAISAAVIKWQTRARKHGIPERASIKLADLAPGKRLVVAPRPMTAAEVAARAKTDAVYRAEVLAALTLDSMEAAA